MSNRVLPARDPSTSSLVRNLIFRNPQGELTFRSRDDLAGLVVKFSMAKLSELAAAARALAR